MPELPEVETTCRGIRPHLLGKKIKSVQVFQPQLRWLVPPELQQIEGQFVRSVERRGKYILIQSKTGCAIVHLGMSGSLRLVKQSLPLEKHDHVQFSLANGQALRLRDPRRFGSVLWSSEPLEQHWLLQKLGPEPLSDEFNLDYLLQRAKGRRVAVKNFIMNSQVVVGVGNIYASEALFLSGILPTTAAGKISKARFERLLRVIKAVLAAAIEQGGTTLKDFVQADGKPGYFQQKLHVYGRKNEACLVCEKPIEQVVLGQRSTFFCSTCQR
ncbi:MAG: bifunctional DNA-formamidopyrimidine glycosylase/DNA-(apurinic or apyrimidinic site) lyase [Gammaproteobacteria bacterium]|nr:bifunctional DNA-formamidopyrimidine glycosylase/DNA-(apurinic or apyrimidinic site) lyase [Gammaproteobacteria bacterium]